MAIFVYEPNLQGFTGSAKGTPLQIATRGFQPDKAPITVGTDGIIAVGRVYDTNLFFGGTAGISVAVDIFPAGTLILEGTEAPVNVTLSGVTTFDYVAEGTLIFGGEAPVTVLEDGTITYTYVPSSGPIVFDGEASSSVGFSLSHVGDGGIIFDGDAGTIFTTKAIEKGGSGVLHRMRKPKWMQPTVTIWEPSLYRKDAPLHFSGGSADTEFVDGKAYKFITTLPKVEKPVDRSKSFIKSLPKRSPVVSEFVSPGATLAPMQGTAVVEFYDHGAYLRNEDDMLIGMLMEDDTQPIVAVAYDKKLNGIRKDDEAILEKLLF